MPETGARAGMEKPAFPSRRRPMKAVLWRTF